MSSHKLYDHRSRTGRAARAGPPLAIGQAATCVAAVTLLARGSRRMCVAAAATEVHCQRRPAPL